MSAAPLKTPSWAVPLFNDTLTTLTATIALLVLVSILISIGLKVIAMGSLNSTTKISEEYRDD
jgi:hypothetical protein